jgi:hypothetical protein
MQLTYRGLPYSSDASVVESASNEMIGQYRGSMFMIGALNSTTSPSSATLRYRGITYRHEH